MIIYGPMEGELSDKSPRGTSSGMEKCFNSSQLHAPHAGIRDHCEMSSGVPFLFIEMECLRRFCCVHLGRRYWMGVLQFCVRCVHPSSFGDRCVWGLEFQTGPANVGAVVDDDDRH